MKIELACKIRTEARPNCILCNSPGRLLYASQLDWLFGVPGAWDLKQCSSAECGLAWLDPMPIKEELSKLYEKYSTHAPGSCFIQPATGVRRKIGRALLAGGFGYRHDGSQLWSSTIAKLAMRSRFVRARVGSGVAWLDAAWRGRLIDVGCGNGEFLVRMRELGWDGLGVEPDAEAVKIARDKYGLAIVAAELEAADLEPGSFDAITMNHVIEHLHDPLATLKRARELLTSRGHLIIQTPNLSSLGHRWFGRGWRGLEPPRHLFLFNAKALAKLLLLAGFRVFRFENNAIGADSMWHESACDGSRNGRNRTSSNASAQLFMLFEHVATGWPFYRPWGEQLAVIAANS